MSNPAPTGKKSSNYGVSTAVLKYFEARPNRRVYIDDLVKSVRYPIEAVRMAINNIRNGNALKATGASIETLSRGQIYVFRPAAEPKTSPVVEAMHDVVVDSVSGIQTELVDNAVAKVKADKGKRIFEEVSTLKNGAVIIKDQDDVLYRAVEMS